MQPSAIVTYLSHSGFAVETARHVFIFDYYLEEPAGGGLQNGVIRPSELRGKQVTVLVSHGHYDHYNPHIFDWRASIPGIRYVLSDDISPPKGNDILSLAPNQTVTCGGLHISTLASTDLGVAFVVEVDGLHLYHAGDLNWWHWVGEPDEDNQRMEFNYRREIQKLEGFRLDLAFVPLDPRQEQNYLLGLDYLMRHVDARAVFPMHTWERTDVFDWLEQDARAASYRSRVHPFKQRGQQFFYQK